MLESSVTTKGQTTLPKDVRDSLAVKAGDRGSLCHLGRGSVDTANTVYQPPVS